MKETIDQFSDRLRGGNASIEDITTWYWRLHEKHQAAKKKITVLERGCACFRQWQREGGI